MKLAMKVSIALHPGPLSGSHPFCQAAGAAGDFIHALIEDSYGQ